MPLPTSLIEYPDYSLAMACRPTVVFPNAPKGIYSSCTQEGPTIGGSTS